MKTMVTLTHEEAQSYLAYALICETMEGAFWNSGRRRRLYSKTFTETEQRQIPRIKATAHKWCLVTGVKNGSVNVEFKTPSKSGKKSTSLKKLKIIKTISPMRSAWDKVS